MYMNPEAQTLNRRKRAAVGAEILGSDQGLLLRHAPTHPHPTGPSSSSLLLSILEMNDIKLYQSQIRALLGTASHFCEVVVLRLRAGPLTSREGTA